MSHFHVQVFNSVYKMSPDPWQLDGGSIQTYIKVLEDRTKSRIQHYCERSELRLHFELNANVEIPSLSCFLITLTMMAVT